MWDAVVEIHTLGKGRTRGPLEFLPVSRSYNSVCAVF